MRRDLGPLAEHEHELLIVGGGVYGAAAAWDATERGLKVALVEASDFGSGVSWNSLKTIHGGLRYLQSLDLPRVRESIRERSALLRIAPEIVSPLRFLVPVYGHGTRGREAFALGLRLNDWLSRARNEGLREDRQLPDSRLLAPEEMARLVPELPSDGLTGGASWWDAQVTSSERLTLGYVRGAAEAGACVANYVEATAFLHRDGRVCGAHIRDALTGSHAEVRARLVLNAAGPQAEEVMRRAGIERRRSVPLLRAINLVLRKALVREHALGGTAFDRYLFLAPWRGLTLLGTDYAPAETVAGPTEVERLLESAAGAFPWAKLSRGDVSLVHRGLVPGSEDARGLWHRHVLIDHQREDGVAGLVSMIGVKYTMARAVAQQAVDLVVARLGRKAAPCRTASTPLAYARPLEGPLVEQARSAVRDEMAHTLNDALLRRLDLGTAGAPQAGDVECVAGVMAAELGWSAMRQAEEMRSLLETYRV